MHAPHTTPKQPRAAPVAPKPPAGPLSAPALGHTGDRLAFQLFTRTGADDAGAEREADAAAATVSGGGAARVGAESAPGARGHGALLGVIVDDGVSPGPGQIERTAFIDSIRPEIERVATEQLTASGRTARDCPYLDQWLRFYRERSAVDVERAIQLYARPARTDLASVRDAVLARVRVAVQAWVKSGGKDVQAPDGAGLPESAAAAAVQRKSADGAAAAAAPSADPAAVRGQLHGGRPMEGGLRSRMESGFGLSFGDVRLHTETHASQLAGSFSARAFTVGSDIAFADGQYRPGTPTGDLLIAHELAHVVQQRGAGPQPAPQLDEEPVEREARLAAGSALLRQHSQAHEAALQPHVGIAQGQGLRLSRCKAAEQVPDLTTLDAKAEWIRATLAGDARFEPRPGEFLGRSKGQAIVDVLATLSAAEFIDIQTRIDMSVLLDELTEFESIKLGTLGPVQGDVRTRLNRMRADYLYQMTRDRGPAEGQVVGHWMFNTMYGDDIHDVLTLLGADQHLYNTVDQMPAVLELFTQRGIDRTAFKDRSWTAGDIGRGLKHFGESFLDSSELGKSNKASKYLSEDLEMPAAYREAMQQTMRAEFDAAMTPGNAAYGVINHVLLGIPSSVVGVVTGTISGIGDLSEGHVEAGTEKLAGPVVMVILLALGIRAFRKSTRMAALLEMTEEGQVALVRLRASIGQKGIDRVAKYVQADSKAAFLVREQGLAGIEALDKAAGNVAAARKLITPDVVRLGTLLQADTLTALGLETQQALATLSDGTLKALAGADAATLDALAGLLGETSPAMRARLTALAESNPAAFGELLKTQKVAALDALRTGPFASVQELSDAVGKSAQRFRVPVTKDGVTVYESIDPAKPPAGWTFKDTVTKRGGSTTIRTDVTGPNGANGHFVRRINAATGEMEMLEAYLRSSESGPEIPASVRGGVELREGKGTPTVTYATLRQLRLEGVKMGGLRRLIMRNIENLKSICRLEWMRKNFPGRPLEQLVLDTDSVGYASTAAEQAGSRIASRKLTGGKTQPIGKLMARLEAEAAAGGEAALKKVQGEHDALLKQYGLTRESQVLMNFDIELGLEPIPPPAPTPAVTTP